MTEVSGGGLPPGTELNGIYQIVERIGVGGMGEVYSAREIHSGNQVAIKMILPELAHDQLVTDLFRREASTLNSLRHEAIVSYSVFSVDPHLRRPYLAMEFAYGPSLRERLRRGRPLSHEQFDTLRRRIAGGLAAAHRAGIVHRDMSPDNIILVDDNVEKAKIIDFGIAKSGSSEKTLIGDSMAGKMGYAAPEQVGLAGAQVSDKSDVYALGIVFAEALTARPMNMGGTQVEVVDKRRSVPNLDHVPAEWRPLIAQMLDPEPARRPSMAEVAEWSPRTVAARREKPNSGGGILKGLVFALLGLGVLAGAAAAIWVFLLDVTRLEPPSSDRLVAAPGEAGVRYRWVGPAFTYDGPPGDLEFSLVGDLPVGLAFQAAPDGTWILAGTPAASAEAEFSVRAAAPDGTAALQPVALSIAPTTNTPPTVVDRVATALVLAEGQRVGLEIGVFEDDGGAESLSIRTNGAVPDGLSVQAANGRARLSGAPERAGTYSFQVTATDVQGASTGFDVNLKVTPKPDETDKKPIRQGGQDGHAILPILAAANSGGCIFALPQKLSARAATIEAFAADAPPIIALDAEIKRKLGYEAQISGRIVSGEQCRVLKDFARVGTEGFLPSTAIRIPNDTPAPGQIVKGIVSGGAGARLYHVDASGRIGRPAGRSVAAGTDLEFQTDFSQPGPHLIVAAIPTDGAALIPQSTEFGEAVTAAERGEVRFAVGYLVVK